MTIKSVQLTFIGYYMTFRKIAILMTKIAKKMSFSPKTIAKNCHIFQKKKPIGNFLKNMTIFLEKMASLWQFFDIQMAISGGSVSACV